MLSQHTIRKLAGTMTGMAPLTVVAAMNILDADPAANFNRTSFLSRPLGGQWFATVEAREEFIALHATGTQQASTRRAAKARP